MDQIDGNPDNKEESRFMKYYRKIKTGADEIVKHRLHYPLAVASSSVFLDYFTTSVGINNFMLKEMHPLNIYIQTSLNIPMQDSIIIGVAALGIGVVGIGAVADEVYHHYKERGRESKDDDKISKYVFESVESFYKNDSYRATRLMCWLKTASSAAGVASAAIPIISSL